MLKLGLFLKRLLTAFFVSIVYRPGRIILRFIFYKIVVRFYQRYLSFIKKIGFRGAESSVFGFLLGQKLVHLTVVVITASLVFTNLITNTQAQSLSDRAYQTILSSLIQSEFGELEENQLIEEFFDQEEFISPVQQSYLDNLATAKNQPFAEMKAPDEIIEQEEQEEIYLAKEEGELMVKPEIASTQKTKRTRTEIVYHTVRPGDTVSTIAQEYEVSVNTILWENNLSAYSLIRPGNKLAILPNSGVTHKVTKGDTLSKISNKYDVDEKKILEANKITSESKLAIGESLIIPGGRKTTYSSATTNRYSGIDAIKSLIKPSGVKPASGNKMNWPTEGHRITQYYSWRHYALDIANKTGTPIYAADAGIVEVAGWGRGYGYQILINHGGGKKTRYAHLSKVYVTKGQRVGKGETVGAMGSTGWSTGSHVHFEVIINNRKYNPLNYIR